MLLPLIYFDAFRTLHKCTGSILLKNSYNLLLFRGKVETQTEGMRLGEGLMTNESD